MQHNHLLLSIARGQVPLLLPSVFFLGISVLRVFVITIPFLSPPLPSSLPPVLSLAYFPLSLLFPFLALGQ